MEWRELLEAYASKNDLSYIKQTGKPLSLKVPVNDKVGQTENNSIPQFYFASPRSSKVRTLSHTATLNKMKAWLLSEEDREEIRDQLLTCTREYDNKSLLNESQQHKLSDLRMDLESKLQEITASAMEDSTNEVAGKTSNSSELELRIKAILTNFNTLRGVLETPRINYDTFCILKQRLESSASCSNTFQRYFTAQTFLQFPQDSMGRINGSAFLSYVSTMNTNLENYLTLSLYDPQGTGYLDEDQFGSFVSDLLATVQVLQEKVTEDLKPFYILSSTRIFFFVLDAKRTKRISIKDVLSSPLLKELLSLENDGTSADENNWFYPAFAQKLYRQFCQLDKDKNGQVSRVEFKRYGKAKAFRKGKETVNDFTPVFLDRVFEECATDEMDYNAFIDFTLGLKYLSQKQGLTYFFNFLDINKTGALDQFTLNYFLRDILNRMEELGGEDGPALDVIRGEIVDMIKHHEQGRNGVTLTDLIKSKAVGETFVRILIDFNGFWDYENRATPQPPNSDESRGEDWPWSE